MAVDGLEALYRKYDPKRDDSDKVRFAIRGLEDAPETTGRADDFSLMLGVIEGWADDESRATGARQFILSTIAGMAKTDYTLARPRTGTPTDAPLCDDGAMFADMIQPLVGYMNRDWLLWATKAARSKNPAYELEELEAMAEGAIRGAACALFGVVLVSYGLHNDREAVWVDMPTTIAKTKELTHACFAGVVDDLIGSAQRSLAKKLQDAIERHFTPRGALPPKPGSEPPKQDQITVRKQYGAVANTTQALTKESLFSDSGELLDAGGGVKTHFVLAVSDEDVKLSSKIDEFDKNVLSAVASLKEAGGRYFTPAQICTAMGIKKPKESQKKSVLERMERMSMIRATIDFAGESKRRGLDVDSDVIRGPLLDFYSREIKAKNGKTVTGLDIRDLPITYQHAKAIGQLVSYPQRYLTMGEGSATERNQIIRRIVCERIEQMKNKHSRISNVIRYEHSDTHPDTPGLFERAGIDVSSKFERAKARKFVASLLDDLVKDGAIHAWSEVRDGRKVVGVKIDATAKVSKKR